MNRVVAGTKNSQRLRELVLGFVSDEDTLEIQRFRFRRRATGKRPLYHFHLYYAISGFRNVIRNKEDICGDSPGFTGWHAAS